MQTTVQVRCTLCGWYSSAHNCYGDWTPKKVRVWVVTPYDSYGEPAAPVGVFSTLEKASDSIKGKTGDHDIGEYELDAWLAVTDHQCCYHEYESKTGEWIEECCVCEKVRDDRQA